MSKSNTGGLMDTSPGGENTQYESTATFVQPPSIKGGQLSTPTAKPTTEPVSAERGEKTAENIRYGQGISEQGVGGFTDPKLNSGEVDKSEEGTGDARTEQGYGEGNEMGRDVGA